MKSFGELIRDGLKRAGLTQREFAARIILDEGRPMSPPYLNDLEHNPRKPPRTSEEQVLAAFRAMRRELKKKT